MDELENQLIEAQNKYDDYKSRYEGFCNKEDWDDTYDHIAQNAMCVYLGKLLNKVETIKKLIDDLKSKNTNTFPSNSLLLKAINNPNVTPYTGLTEEEKRTLYEQRRTCSNCESRGEVKDIRDRITYYQCPNCDKIWERWI